MVTQHTSTGVDSIPDPSVDLVRISATLTSHSEVLFLIFLTLPGLSDPVAALIDSGATSNFLDSSLAALPPFVLEPLDCPIALCLFDGKPATAGFIHESVNISVSFADHSTQSLSLLVMKLHLSALIILGLPWLQSTNLTIDWPALFLMFKTGPRSALPLFVLASVKNGFSNPTKEQEGQDQPRQDIMTRCQVKALREGCRERKEARMGDSSREKMNTNKNLVRATTKSKSKMQTVSNGHVGQGRRDGGFKEHPNVGDLVE